jgi:hypothetical protein
MCTVATTGEILTATTEEVLADTAGEFLADTSCNNIKCVHGLTDT